MQLAYVIFNVFFFKPIQKEIFLFFHSNGKMVFTMLRLVFLLLVYSLCATVFISASTLTFEIKIITMRFIIFHG